MVPLLINSKNLAKNCDFRCLFAKLFSKSQCCSDASLSFISTPRTGRPHSASEQQQLQQQQQPAKSQKCHKTSKSRHRICRYIHAACDCTPAPMLDVHYCCMVIENQRDSITLAPPPSACSCHIFLYKSHLLSVVHSFFHSFRC